MHEDFPEGTRVRVSYEAVVLRDPIGRPSHPQGNASITVDSCDMNLLADEFKVEAVHPVGQLAVEDSGYLMRWNGHVWQWVDVDAEKKPRWSPLDGHENPPNRGDLMRMAVLPDSVTPAVASRSRVSATVNRRSAARISVRSPVRRS